MLDYVVGHLDAVSVTFNGDRATVVIDPETRFSEPELKLLPEAASSALPGIGIGVQQEGRTLHITRGADKLRPETWESVVLETFGVPTTDNAPQDEAKTGGSDKQQPTDADKPESVKDEQQPVGPAMKPTYGVTFDPTAPASATTLGADATEFKIDKLLIEGARLTTGSLEGNPEVLAAVIGSLLSAFALNVSQQVKPNGDQVGSDAAGTAAQQ
jgi:hypothetical protein